MIFNILHESAINMIRLAGEKSVTNSRSLTREELNVTRGISAAHLIAQSDSRSFRRWLITNTHTLGNDMEYRSHGRFKYMKLFVIAFNQYSEVLCILQKS